MNWKKRLEVNWGRLGMKYKIYQVSDLIEEISMGPFGSNIKVDCFVESGIPVLMEVILMAFVYRNLLFAM